MMPKILHTVIRWYLCHIQKIRAGLHISWGNFIHKMLNTKSLILKKYILTWEHAQHKSYTKKAGHATMCTGRYVLLLKKTCRYGLKETMSQNDTTTDSLWMEGLWMVSFCLKIFLYIFLQWVKNYSYNHKNVFINLLSMPYL